MKTGGGHTLKPQRQLWLAVWRHGPWVWVGLGGLLILTTGLYVAIALDRTYHGPAARRPALDTLVPAMLTIAGLGFGAAAVLVVSWLRVLRGSLVVLQPGGKVIATRTGFIQMASLWLVVSLPLLIIVAILHRGVEPSLNSGLLWIQALGLTAMAMAGATAALTLGKVGFWSVTALFWCVMALVMATNTGLLLLDPADLHQALSVLGLSGAPVLGGVLLGCHRRLLGPGASASHPLDELSNMAKLEYTASGGARELFRLGVGDLQRSLKEEAFALFINLGLLLVVFNSRFIPGTETWVFALAVLMLSFLSQSTMLLPIANPRLAVLPGGWHRQTSEMSALLGRLWPWLFNRLDLARMGLALSVVGFSLQPPWALALALALAVFAVRIWSGCVALATMPLTHGFAARFAVNLAAPLPLAVVFWLMVLVDWPPASDHPESWLARAVMLLAGAVVLGWLMLLASRSAWQRMDWAEQPVSPLMVGQAARGFR